jgi:Cdc6-like AAA superfamily ATPase
MTMNFDETTHEIYDAVALLHEAATNGKGFTTMETIRAKFLPTQRDALLAASLNSLIANAVQREDAELPPSFENRGRGSGLALIGPTGVGKSRSLERFFDKHPVLRGYADPTSRSPLVSVAVPSPCTSMQLARALLRATGYNVERELAAHRLWELAFDRLHHMKKFIVHFDEMQHVVHNMPDKDLQQMADTLKNAMYNRRITIILSGVDTLKPFLQHDPQLLRRLSLVPFDNVTRETQFEIAHAVSTYAAAANLAVKLTSQDASPASQEEMAEFIARLSHAALNAYGYAIVLTHLAIEQALQDGSEHLVLEHFATAFARKSGHAANRNPFLAAAWLDIDCKKVFRGTETTSPVNPMAKTKSGKGAK